MFFSAWKFWDRWKKILENWLIDYFVTLSINQCDSLPQIYETVANPFSFFKSFFFWRKLCLVSLLLLHYWAIQIRYFRKKLLLQQIQFIWRFEKRLMVLQYFIIDNNTRMSVFLWEMFFNNIMNITSTWCINQFLVLNTFSFLFPRSFLVINWISISLDSLCLESSDSFHFVFEFLDISCPFIDDVKVTV